jgi:hypothetical protein
MVPEQAEVYSTALTNMRAEVKAVGSLVKEQLYCREKQNVFSQGGHTHRPCYAHPP